MKLKKILATLVAVTSIFTLTGCENDDIIDALEESTFKNATVDTTVTLHFVEEDEWGDPSDYDLEEKYHYETDGYESYYHYTIGSKLENTEFYHYAYFNPENRNEMCYVQHYDNTTADGCLPFNSEETDDFFEITEFKSVDDILEDEDFKKKKDYYYLPDAEDNYNLVNYILAELEYDYEFGADASCFTLFKTTVRLDKKGRLSYLKIEAKTEEEDAVFTYETIVSKVGKTHIVIPE